MSHQSEPSVLGRAVLFKGNQQFDISSYSLKSLADKEILVQNLYTTICGSDIHTFCGIRSEPIPLVLGHEIVGDVIAIQSENTMEDLRGEKINIGDRIIWAVFSTPEEGDPPRNDLPQKTEGIYKYGHVSAENGDVFNGGLADYCIIRNRTAFLKISSQIPLKVAAPIGCTHATAAGALRVAGDVKGKKVLILGAGMLGLSCLAMCKEAGARTAIIDREVSRLMWASDFGADTVFLAKNMYQLPEVDIVIDMTGNHEAMLTGLRVLTTGGIAVWVGAVFPAPPVPVDAESVVRKVLQIRGLHNYNYDDFKYATRFIENNYQKYPFEQIVSREFPLEMTEEAFSYAVKEKPIRVGIKIK